MSSKEYYLSLLASSFLTEFDIPLNLLLDTDIRNSLIRYNWQINQNISEYDWVTLYKTGVYRD